MMMKVLFRIELLEEVVAVRGPYLSCFGKRRLSLSSTKSLLSSYYRPPSNLDEMMLMMTMTIHLVVQSTLATCQGILKIEGILRQRDECWMEHF